VFTLHTTKLLSLHSGKLWQCLLPKQTNNNSLQDKNYVPDQKPEK